MMVHLYNETPYKATEIMRRGFKSGTVKRTPEHLEILANAYFNSREFNDAIPPLKEAANRSEKGQLSYRLGQAYLQSEKWSDAEKAKEASEKITQIREQASEEFENVMLSSHAGEVFASN